MLGAVAAEFVDEVGDHGDVDEQNHDFGGGDVVEEFVDFEGNERSGHDDGEIFCPAFAKGQADSFGQEQAGVEKGADAQFFEFVIVDDGKFFQKFMDKDALGIDAKEVDPAGNFSGDVPMQEPEGTDAHGKQCEAFYKLESGD